MRGISVSSMMTFGAGMAAAAVLGSQKISKRSMRKMKRKVRALL